MRESIRDLIESAVRERRISAVRALAAQLLRDERSSLQARLDVSNYLRRLSEFSAGLAVLDAPARTLDPNASAEVAARYDLQLSRMLNLMGASRYALKVLDGVDSSTLQANVDAALEILNSNYLYDRALPLALSAQVSLAGASYTERLRAVSVADTYFGAGRAEQAHDLLDQVLVNSSEPLLLGIGNQAKAAFLILKEKADRAELYLQAAERFFPEGDRTFDRGYLEKWIGAARILRGELAPAEEALRRARQLLHRPGFKPEAWLEVVYWEGLLKFRQARVFPLEWARLYSYPAPTEHRLVKEIRKHTQIPARFCLRTQQFGSEREKWLIDFESRVERREGHWHWGLKLPTEAAGWLVLAGQDGVPIFRLCDALWPDETLSVRSNIKRVEQVLLRCRNELGFAFRWSGRHVFSRAKKPACLWSKDAPTPGLRFLREHQRFSRAELEEYFRISPRAAINILAGWKKKKIVRPVGKHGRIQIYGM